VSWGDRLRWARERAGLSQRELAKHIEVTGQSVYLWEKGENVPTAAHQAEVRNLLGVPIREGPYVMEEPAAEGWGQKVRRARKERGWSQRELARRMGVSSSTSSRWETGSVTPKMENRVRVALLLDVGLEIAEGELVERAAERVLAFADHPGEYDEYDGLTADDWVEAYVAGDRERWGELIRTVAEQAEQMRPDIFVVREGAA